MEQVDLIRERTKLTRSMLEHPAWPLLVRDWQEEADALKHQLVYQPVTQDEIRGFWRGKLDVLERLIKLPAILDSIEESLDGTEEAD